MGYSLISFFLSQTNLQVYDGEGLSPLKLCGATLPEPIRSQGNSIRILFESGSFDQHRGFKATYQSTIFSGKCFLSFALMKKTNKQQFIIDVMTHPYNKQNI